VDLDQAIREMHYFEEGRLPHVTHGICDSCRERLKRVYHRNKRCLRICSS
jgi:hypothetical protein